MRSFVVLIAIALGCGSSGDGDKDKSAGSKDVVTAPVEQTTKGAICNKIEKAWCDKCGDDACKGFAVSCCSLTETCDEPMPSGTDWEKSCLEDIAKVAGAECAKGIPTDCMAP